MSGSDRGYLFAAIGVVLAALLVCWWLYPEQPQLTGNVGYQEQHAGYRAGGYDCDPLVIRGLPNREGPRRAKSCEEAEEQHRLASNDLVQQRRSADAADASAIFAYQQTGIGAWGAFLGIVTMSAAIAAAWFAKRAADETRRGADAAERAVESSRHIGEAQVRAYLSIKSMDGQIVNGGVCFRIIVQNSGQSPALSAQVKIEIIDEDGEKIPISPLHEHFIPANGVTELSYCYLKSADAPTWSGIVVFVTVAYSDVFSNIRKVSDKFAGTPNKWKVKEFTALAQGMHIASYLGSMGDG